jgi:hypothetical protein
VTRRIKTTDFAWKRVAFCDPRFLHPHDEPLVGSIVSQVVPARRALLDFCDSGADVLALRAFLKMPSSRARFNM